LDRWTATQAAPKAPQRKRPCRSRALSVILTVRSLTCALASPDLAERVDKNDPKSVRKLRRIAEKLAECALNGDSWAIAQVADRIDGKPKQESDVTVASTRYVVEVPADLSDDEWEKKYSPPPALNSVQ
jgi:hypothetical protein